jgi:hypothetical protein
MDRVNPVHGWFTFINSNYSEGLTMARLSYKGFRINLKPLRDVKDLWQLEIDRGDYVTTRSVGTEMTLKAIEDYAFNEIDKIIEEEKKS